MRTFTKIIVLITTGFIFVALISKLFPPLEYGIFPYILSVIGGISYEFTVPKLIDKLYDKR